MTVGIDEAGRGPMAGPMIAVAVLMEGVIEGLGDSKKLTAGSRASLLRSIQELSTSIGVGWVSAQEIDERGLTWAQEVSMSRAYGQLSGVSSSDEVILDGSVNYLQGVANTQCVVKADAKFPAVMAASIVAKELRDRYMERLDSIYPEYGFARHKGYITKAHLETLRVHGPIKGLHRFSYKTIKEMMPG